MRARHRRILTLLLTIGVVGTIAGWGAYSAFTATTANSGNTITAGTVAIGQHAGATTLYSGSDQGPGSSIVKCVRVTYTGSLASSRAALRLERHHERLGVQPEGRAWLGPLVAGRNDELHRLLVLVDSVRRESWRLRDELRRRCRRQGRRRGLEPERQRRLPLHDHRQRRLHAERTHFGPFVRRAHLHLGGPQQLTRLPIRNQRERSQSPLSPHPRPNPFMSDCHPHPNRLGRAARRHCDRSRPRLQLAHRRRRLLRPGQGRDHDLAFGAHLDHSGRRHHRGAEPRSIPPRGRAPADQLDAP